MQAGELTIANLAVGHIEPNLAVGHIEPSSLTGKIGNLMARVFGCRHAELSRPFSRGGRAYRSCVNCGAQRQFNLGNWQMQGNFYYGRPSVSHSSLSN